ncbi:MAG: ABC-type transport auxiliary lipoprotein family protein [Gammaproteobacteria bacterium]|nr:ABC-type transport auxiliary lipoprotein family protein [Gammaproteobacteria bacterium]
MWLSLLGFSLLTSCTPVKTPVTNQYTLTLSQHKIRHHTPMHYALLISKPEAMSGYRTEQMLYVNHQFTLQPFAKNAWTNPPADMLYPLLVQGFQDSHAFRAITSSPYADKADYRLDTQLIELNQNFLSKKSMVHFVAKITVIRVSDNHVIASRLITHHIPCLKNTPYGGVVAANQASNLFIRDALNFVIKQVRNDRGSQKT